MYVLRCVPALLKRGFGASSFHLQPAIRAACHSASIDKCGSLCSEKCILESSPACTSCACAESRIHVRYLETGPKGTYIAKKIPAYVTVQAGKTYAWCLCGLSKKQPFCDGSHKSTEFKPVRFKLEETKRVLLCRCKQTSNRPYCDMTHVSVMMNSFKNKIFGSKKK